MNEKEKAYTKKEKWIFSIIAIALSAAFFFISITVSGCICDPEKPMRCCYTMKCETWLSILTLCLCIGQLFIKNRDAGIYSSVSVILLLLTGYIFMTGFSGLGLCTKSEMACHSKALLLGVVMCALIITEILQAIIVYRNPDRQKYGF